MIKLLSIYIIIFFSLYTPLVMANSAILRLTPEKNILHKGDVYKGILEIHPVEEKQRTDFFSLSGKEIDKKIKILKIYKIVPNANNIDVLEVHGLFANINTFNPLEPLLLKSATTESPLRVKTSKVLDTKVTAKSLTIINQNKKSLPWKTTTIVLVLLIMIMSAYFIIKAYVIKSAKKIRAMKEKENIQKWNTYFQQANSREEFEHIFDRKKEWGKLITVQTPPIVEFKRIMLEHQYKEEWSKNEFQDVKFSFDNIKGIFE